MVPWPLFLEEDSATILHCRGALHLLFFSLAPVSQPLCQSHTLLEKGKVRGERAFYEEKILIAMLDGYILVF